MDTTTNAPSAILDHNRPVDVPTDIINLLFEAVIIIKNIEGLKPFVLLNKRFNALFKKNRKEILHKMIIVTKQYKAGEPGTLITRRAFSNEMLHGKQVELTFTDEPDATDEFIQIFEFNSLVREARFIRVDEIIKCIKATYHKNGSRKENTSSYDALGNLISYTEVEISSDQKCISKIEYYPKTERVYEQTYFTINNRFMTEEDREYLYEQTKKDL